MHEDLKTLTERLYWRPLYKDFEPIFLDVLQTKFEPSTRSRSVDGRASEFYCDNHTSIRNCVLFRSLGLPLVENETSIIALTNHLPFRPRLKRENDKGLAYVIDPFQSGLDVNRWLQPMYNSLVCLWVYMSLCHMRKDNLTYLNHQHLQLVYYEGDWSSVTQQFCCLDFNNASNGTTINCNNKHVNVDSP